MKTEKQQAAAAEAFAERWRGKGYERGESQLFWADLLTSVFGVENLPEFIRYEERVASMVDSTNFIDGHIPRTRVLIEQKSLGKNLRAGIRQSDGSVLNPFQQAKRYVANMPLSEHPRWIVTCNFAEFLVYDMEQPNGEPESILLDNLGKEYYRLQFLVDERSEHLTKEMRVSMQAGEIVGRIYEALLRQYDDNSPKALRWLNILCVRIVFCLYAEDAGIFAHDQFHDYLARYDADDLRNALIRLFETLNKPEEQRSRYLKDDLKAFPYTNGGLFEEEIEIPQFTEQLKQVLLQNAALDFDWSEISPTIFGAVFESTLNPETRRAGGMHYTSIENIHKVIDPLFLNDLRRELDNILEEKVERLRNRRLDAFQDHLASLTFLDPACGSGNFLTETYLSLRRLENEAIRERYHGQSMLGAFVNPVKVSIQQFYGIEINDFAVTVATTALWISEAQMLRETERIVHQDIDFLPLKAYHNIREGNALRMDWGIMEFPSNIPTIYAKNTYLILEDEQQIASEPLVDYNEINLITAGQKPGPKPPTRVKVKYDYIIGNPPFVGHQWRSVSQVSDMNIVFRGFGNYGKLDYVAGWYKKAAELMQGTRTQATFVSTNSICQGESVATFWKPLFEKYDVKINFAWQPFVWDSEATEKAHVHVVIIGFSCFDKEKKYIFESKDFMRPANYINGYLYDAPDIFIENRGKPLTEGMPKMTKGSQATDGSNLILTTEEREEMVARYPNTDKFIKRIIGADDFINNKYRYCLWLKGVAPNEYAHIHPIIERLKAISELRRKSPTKSVQANADTPMLFTQIRQPDSDYLVIPRISSFQRRYIPIGYMSKDVIANDKVMFIPKASLYLFGVLMSNVHMAWMRVTAGRLKSDYSYTPAVYNNFPWPSPTKAEKERIEKTAQAILDAREMYPQSSLADLYKEVTMPPELRRAHQQNDRAVMEAYGWKASSHFTESQCVAELFKMYRELTK